MSNSFVYCSPKNPNSHLTIKSQKLPSFPAKHLFSLGQIQGRVLDFGCGLGFDVTFLRNNGFETIGYDPHYSPNIPNGQFDTILCSYVLDVLLPEEQIQVLMAIAEFLKPTGKAFYAVRRDIRKSGFRTDTKLGVEVYQCNVILPYKSVIRTEHCEIYEYRHFNQVTKVIENSCPFCFPEKDRELVTESAIAYALFDKYPVSLGHTLIIPKQHTANYFELSEPTKKSCWAVVDRVRMQLSQRFHPDGFNIGINIGDAAGQTVPHVHIHLIPRYKGDVTNPRGGVRRIIPGKGDYLEVNQW